MFPGEEDNINVHLNSFFIRSFLFGRFSKIDDSRMYLIFILD